MRTKVILFFLDNATGDFTFVFATRRPSLQVKHLLINSSENELIDAHKGVQKKKSAYRKHFSLS